MSVIIDTDFIREHTSNLEKSCFAINGSQCKLIGLDFQSLKKGWLKNFKSIEVSNARAELFKLLHGVNGKKNQMKIIEDFKKGIK